MKNPPQILAAVTLPKFLYWAAIAMLAYRLARMAWSWVRKQAAAVPARSKGQIRTAANRIVPLYVAWNQPEQAEAWRQKLKDDALPTPATLGKPTP